MEIWVQSISAPSYEISDKGRIRKLESGKIISTSVGKRWGYSLVNLKIGQKWKTCKVHRLVCEAFHGPPPEGKNDVAHWDGVRTNNFPDNLRWASRKENMADAIRHGTTHAKRGSDNANSKLTECDVIAIRAEPRRKGVLYDLAKKFGVSRNVIGNIRTKGSPCWNHIR